MPRVDRLFENVAQRVRIVGRDQPTVLPCTTVSFSPAQRRGDRQHAHGLGFHRRAPEGSPFCRGPSHDVGQQIGRRHPLAMAVEPHRPGEAGARGSRVRLRSDRRRGPGRRRRAETSKSRRSRARQTRRGLIFTSASSLQPCEAAGQQDLHPRGRRGRCARRRATFFTFRQAKRRRRRSGRDRFRAGSPPPCRAAPGVATADAHA